MSSRRSQRVRFPGGGGHALAGIIDHAAEPSAPVVVLSHCFTCNKDLKALVRIARRLADRGVTVLRFDMTGLGGSEGDFADTNFTTNVADLRAAISLAIQSLGRVDALVGHSFGGAASLAVTGQNALDPQATPPGCDIRSVAILAAPSDTQHLARLLVRMNPAIEAAGVGDVSIGGVTWTIRRQMIDDFARHDLTRLISAIDVPVTLFHSPVDATVGWDHALRIQTLINAAQDRDPLASVVLLPGADHLLAQQPRDVVYVADMIAAQVQRFSR